jgi:CBS domain containing-hemolysin-like protein
MALHGIDTMPVVDREDDQKVIGIVSLPQLLQGRLRDQQEARERERVLRIRLVGRH